ncbi:hypothetical protein MesoLj131c_29440 [Mesorhizobium sp. 131-3-5]|nr:hypothetical protein MesoLj131c_29440 [Mesorhizobium sp. 131-3-5]
MPPGLIPESEWYYLGLPERRKTFLSQQVPFEEVADRIARGSTVLDPGLEPYYSGKTAQEKEARRAVFTLRLDPPELCDLFFSGRSGLRACYWQGPEIGDAATQHLIKVLLPKLLEAASRAPMPRCGAVEMSEPELLTSLTMPSAKIWPAEFERNNVGGLEVKRWRDNPHPRLGQQWRWVPERCDLEVKGALIDLRQFEHVPPSKLDRAGQIHRHGFT